MAVLVLDDEDKDADDDVEVDEDLFVKLESE